MRIDNRDFYADIVRSEGGVSYYVIQSRWNDEVIYCGRAQNRDAAVQAANNYLDDLAGQYEKLAS